MRSSDDNVTDGSRRNASERQKRCLYACTDSFPRECDEEEYDHRTERRGKFVEIIKVSEEDEDKAENVGQQPCGR